jgi:hypothetical protein
MPLVVMPTSATPGTPASWPVSSVMSGRSVGSPPVSRILLMPAPANSLACSTKGKCGQKLVCAERCAGMSRCSGEEL